MYIITVGLNHRTAPIVLREQLALSDCSLTMALEELVNLKGNQSPPNGQSFPKDRIKEWVILSTCNRLEVYAAGVGSVVGGQQQIANFLAELQGTGLKALRPHLYFLEGSDAVNHLLNVAAGLDSMILGEPQILGQVTSALREAQGAGTTGPVLSELFKRASHAGKRARTETGIGRHSTSTSHAAAQLIKDKFGSLAPFHLLVIGAGDMAAIVAQALHDRGIGRLSFINRTQQRANKLARQFQGEAFSWYALPDALEIVDGVITATDAPHVVIQESVVRQALPRRRGRLLLFVDIAVPRDVDEAVDDLPGVQRFDIDDLQTTVDANLAQRKAAVPKVNAIIAEEGARFDEWLKARSVLPVLIALRSKAKRIAERELERGLHQLDPTDQEKVSRLVHRVVNKVLHEPTVRLKESAAEGNGLEYAHVLHDLFALDGQTESTPSNIGEIRPETDTRKPAKAAAN
jgi:glutamyl-tRNA reductase